MNHLSTFRSGRRTQRLHDLTHDLIETLLNDWDAVHAIRGHLAQRQHDDLTLGHLDTLGYELRLRLPSRLNDDHGWKTLDCELGCVEATPQRAAPSVTDSTDRDIYLVGQRRLDRENWDDGPSAGSRG